MKPEQVATKRGKIIEVFEGVGGPISIQELTAKCFNQNIWSKDEIDKATLRGLQDEVRRAVNEVDADGCPSALVRRVVVDKDPDGNPISMELFIQRTFWVEQDAVNWVRRRVKQLREDYSKLEKVIDYLGQRFPNRDWWHIAGVHLGDR